MTVAGEWQPRGTLAKGHEPANDAAVAVAVAEAGVVVVALVCAKHGYWVNSMLRHGTILWGIPGGRRSTSDFG